MAKRGSYNIQNGELEIESQIDNVLYCIEHGKLSIYNEDRLGDKYFACVKLCDLPKLAREILEVYEVYGKNITNMEWCKYTEED